MRELFHELNMDRAFDGIRERPVPVPRDLEPLVTAAEPHSGPSASCAPHDHSITLAVAATGRAMDSRRPRP